MRRRDFLARLAASAALVPLSHAANAAKATTSSEAGLIDTNVSVLHWTTRLSWANTTTELASRLRQQGISSAWTASFESVLQTDVARANARVAEICRHEGSGVLLPFGTVNPTLPDWEEDVRRCDEVHAMRGLRLYPNYHGYMLEDPRFRRLVELTAKRRMLLQVALTIEDVRSQSPALEVEPVAPGPLAEIVRATPGARVMVLNGGSRLFSPANAALRPLAAAGVLFETATLEGTSGIQRLLARVPDLRLTFGSHSPYFYLESALLKLQESELTAAQLAAVCSGHARDALAT